MSSSTKGGMLKLDKAKIASEELLDGKFLVSTSNGALDAADVAMGYKQLFEIERVFRDMKNVLEIRPVYHRLDDRIRSHILICWMAMVLVRFAEEALGSNWFSIAGTLDTITAGLIETRSSTLWYKPVSGKPGLISLPRWISSVCLYYELYNASCRKEDIVSIIGGDEFGIILP